MNKKSPRLTFFGGFLLCVAGAYISFVLRTAADGSLRTLFYGILFACGALISLYKTIFPGKPKNDKKKED